MVEVFSHYSVNGEIVSSAASCSNSHLWNRLNTLLALPISQVHQPGCRLMLTEAVALINTRFVHCYFLLPHALPVGCHLVANYIFHNVMRWPAIRMNLSLGGSRVLFYPHGSYCHLFHAI